VINSRKLIDLHPKVAAKAKAFRKHCQAFHGIDVLIYCTYRDSEQQNHLYAQGRTRPGKRITNAKGGQSEHNYRLAWDCVPLQGGKAEWGNKKAYRLMGAVAATLGIDWAGNWKSFKETAHFSFKDGHPFSYFRAGGKL